MPSSQAIEYACKQIAAGAYQDQFVLNMLQGGAGTSTNMNINEVIANAGLEYMGHAKGQYRYLHPNNDVNMSQSTNGVYPTSIKLVLAEMCTLLNAPFQTLIDGLNAKAEKFKGIMKMGRTQLQDAVPMTLVQEFAAFAGTLQKDLQLLQMLAPQKLLQVNLDGTAIGTGLNTTSAYRKLAVEALAELTGKPVQSADNLIEATSDMGDFVLLSGLLKRTATKLKKLPMI